MTLSVSVDKQATLGDPMQKETYLNIDIFENKEVNFGDEVFVWKDNKCNHL